MDQPAPPNTYWISPNVKFNDLFVAEKPKITTRQVLIAAVIILVITWAFAIMYFFIQYHEALVTKEISLVKNQIINASQEIRIIHVFNVSSKHETQRIPEIGGIPNATFTDITAYSVCCRLVDTIYMLCGTEQQYLNDKIIIQKVSLAKESNGDVFLFIYSDNPLSTNSTCTLTISQINA